MKLLLALSAVTLTGCGLVRGDRVGASDAAVSDVGTSEVAASPAVIVRAEGRDLHLALSATHLYWITAPILGEQPGTISRMMLPDGPVEPFVISGADRALRIVGSTAYWTRDDAALLSDDTTSGTGELLATLRGRASYVTLDTKRMLWAETHDDGTSLIGSRNLSDLDRGVVLTDISAPTGLALAEAQVYFTALDGNVYQAGLVGTVATAVATGEQNPSDLTFAAGRLVWINHGNMVTHAGGSLRSMSTKVGPPTELEGFEGEPTAFFVDGDTTYVGIWNGRVGSLVAHSSGGLRSIATNLDQPVSIVATPSNLYVSEKKGDILRLAKP